MCFFYNLHVHLKINLVSIYKYVGELIHLLGDFLYLNALVTEILEYIRTNHKLFCLIIFVLIKQLWTTDLSENQRNLNSRDKKVFLMYYAQK